MISLISNDYYFVSLHWRAGDRYKAQGVLAGRL